MIAFFKIPSSLLTILGIISWTVKKWRPFFELLRNLCLASVTGVYIPDIIGQITEGAYREMFNKVR